MCTKCKSRISQIFLLFLMLNVTLTAQEYRIDSLSIFISSIVDAMPRMNSNGFDVPETNELILFGIMLDSLLSGNTEAAEELSTSLGYRLVNWIDIEDDDRSYLVLHEENAEFADSSKNGWGIFIIAQDYRRNLIIESPHPRWDSRSWYVALKAFKALRARFFIMAGAHRYSNGEDPAPADVAHSIHNLFHIAHARFARLTDHALQIHGFKADSTSQYYGYPDVVLSSAKPEYEPILETLSDELVSGGLSVGIYDGLNYTLLGATTNVQGQFSNNNGLSFVHIELERNVRYSEEKITSVSDALIRSFTPLPADAKESTKIPSDIKLLGRYPNPFNSFMVIQFWLEKPDFVEVRIYSILGSEIWESSRKVLPAGLNNITWRGINSSGQEVASGEYFFEIRAGRERVVGKCSLLR